MAGESAGAASELRTYGHKGASSVCSILEREIKQCHSLQARIQTLSEDSIQCNTCKLLTLLQDTHIPIMQRHLTVHLGEMHADNYVSSMHYYDSIHDAEKTQHVAVELNKSWRNIELIAARRFSHLEQITEHMKQMAIGPYGKYYGPSEDDN